MQVRPRRRHGNGTATSWQVLKLKHSQQVDALQRVLPESLQILNFQIQNVYGTTRNLSLTT